MSKWGGGGFGQKRHGVVSWGEMTNNKGFFVRVFFWVKFGGGRIGGEGGVFVCGVLCWFLGRGCALVFGRGAEVLGRYVCSTRASSFLPFLIKFLGS